MNTYTRGYIRALKDYAWYDMGVGYVGKDKDRPLDVAIKWAVEKDKELPKEQS